ncbi:MAG: NUDIX domain-containing protein [Candidatus Saccharimonadales bacterium]
MQTLSEEILRLHKGVSFVGVTTCFFTYDAEGRFFMGKRSQNTRDEQGRWEIGGGGLKFGQTAEANMLRELKEEYNATAIKSELLGYRDVFRELPDGTKTHWVGLDFAVLVDPAEVKINETEMCDDSGWFTRDTLPSPLHSQQAPFFEKYKAQLDQTL